MKNQKSIKLLIADSSPADVDILIAVLSTDPAIEIIGVATTGKQAINLVSRLKPDIVILALGDPRGGSLEAVKQIMAYNPTPILIMTGPDSQNEGKDNVLKALSMGALDVIEKPISIEQTSSHLIASHSATRESAQANVGSPTARKKKESELFLETVKLLSKIKVVTHLAGKLENNKRHPRNRPSPNSSHPFSGRRVRSNQIRTKQNSATRDPRTPGALDSRVAECEAIKAGYLMPDKSSIQHPASSIQKVVAIAASTGGPSALLEILRRLPVELGIGIVIVQHVAEGFSAGLAEWLDRESEITVREAREGDRIALGYALLAPTGFHMVMKAYAGENRIMLRKTLPQAQSKLQPSSPTHRPSADVLFTSVANIYRHRSIGVILTGMGTDGAKGIVAIKDAGGKTIAQDEQSCVVFGMPKAAIETGAIDEVLPLDSIAERIVRLVMGQ